MSRGLGDVYKRQGYYRLLLNTLCCQFLSLSGESPKILDAGCGEGYYTAGIYEALTAAGKQPKMAGTDISKFILRHAARRCRAVEFAVASSYHLPLGDASVDLLLDGSASQNRQQEKLATQAYLIAESLSRCRIPVRVTAFCSVSGCTVLRVLRDYDHPEQNEGVFDYVAAGWNRDGLALRAMGWLLRQRRSEQSLLLVLSDASPNDDQRIPNGLGGWAYTGKRGVDDTAAEAAALRLRGVLPVCLFTGSDREVPDARRIYGQAMERLPAIGWLADAVTRLIRGQLRRG